MDIYAPVEGPDPEIADVVEHQVVQSIGIEGSGEIGSGNNLLKTSLGRISDTQSAAVGSNPEEAQGVERQVGDDVVGDRSWKAVFFKKEMFELLLLQIVFVQAAPRCADP